MLSASLKPKTSKMAKKFTVRSIALDVLLETETGVLHATDLLDRKMSQSRLEQRDAALVTQLVYGTIRMRGALDWFIARLSSRSLDKISPVALMSIRLALYQIIYLDRIPDYAALNEAVELVKKKENPGAGKFVNAVLRNYLAQKDVLVLPSAQSDLVQYLSTTYSHPKFLVERWIANFGAQKAEDICRINNIPAPLFIRANALRTTRDELAQRLKQEGAQVETVEGFPLALRLTDCHAPSSLPSFRQGLFYVQDVSTMRVVHCLKPQQNETILDMCAAPGGKTTFIAEQMQKRGKVVACDSDASKIKRIHENLSRLGISNVTVVNCDARELPHKYPEGSFDRVLLDAPCSNTGVFRRRVEARWRLKPEDFEKLPVLQYGLLEVAAKMVRKDGVIIYSTCSIDPVENQKIIKGFISQYPSFNMNLEEAFFPVENSGDGGYLARFIRLK
jgi:16S rRNA (cytosine967-C5)-methyltransferase